MRLWGARTKVGPGRAPKQAVASPENKWSRAGERGVEERAEGAGREPRDFGACSASWLRPYKASVSIRVPGRKSETASAVRKKRGNLRIEIHLNGVLANEREGAPIPRVESVIFCG